MYEAMPFLGEGFHFSVGRGELSILTSDGAHVLLTASYLARGNVRHGYAVTGHAAQGATIERAFVLGETDRALKEWAYVGLSRAANATTIYCSGAARYRVSKKRIDASQVSETQLGESLHRSDEAAWGINLCAHCAPFAVPGGIS
jgi:ATP-dependent exoDNAse (exonuclease V) alpha subunit